MQRHPSFASPSRIVWPLALAAMLSIGPPSPVLADEVPQTDPAPAVAEFPTVADKTQGLEARRGFLNFYVDDREGKIWLEVPPPTGERREALQLIYVEGLRTGLGSNPVGLDRGQINDAALLTVRRIGPRVFFEQPNLRYRALSDEVSERQATRESFATSVLWAQDIAALDADGRSLVDLTSFLIRDSHDVTGTLKETEQGEFQLDEGRSLVDPASCLAFPDNVELEALLTFTGNEPGKHVESTAPTPEAITLVAHHSFIRLPQEGYQPRRFDPRTASIPVEFSDYASPLEAAIDKAWILRHRLQKANPRAARSKAVEPLVYYVDRGAPEPVRSALIEGASWWADAFEAAGFIDAFRVELLPEGAHPLDVRYNVIQWVHRSTRGWSYGTSVTDPRTGEILKGHVSLGSLRVRQDRLLFEGLAGTAKTGSGTADDPVQIALARIRQLSAHEVGHTLGLAHNFAASTYGGRASVMDYPAPLITVGDNGELDFSQAYGVGVGAWDVHSIRYAYSELPAGPEETEGLERIVQEGIAAGLTFLSDEDARPAGAAEPRASLWDNGDDPVDALEQSLAVRRLALERFGEHNLPAGRPLAELQEVLATVYFHHRFQLAAAAKALGGMEYDYALRGDAQTATRIVSAERQRRALEVLLGILSPASLDLRDEVLALLAPRVFEAERNREMFGSATEPAFDALGAAATAADQVVAALIQPQRFGRLIDFHRRDATFPGPQEVLEAIRRTAFAAAEGESQRHRELRHVVRRVVVDRLLDLAAAPETTASVRAHVEQSLRRTRQSLGQNVGNDAASLYDLALFRDIERYFRRIEHVPAVAHRPAPLPPGSPIGSGVMEQLGCGAH
ncbi:MAG: zinc-dependent metalloprotease [Acidobacteriota bacterium]